MSETRPALRLLPVDGVARDMMAGGDPLRQVLDAAIALVCSERGAWDLIRGEAVAGVWEPWPQMDLLIAALDRARPGWRARAVAAEGGGHG